MGAFFVYFTSKLSTLLSVIFFTSCHVIRDVVTVAILIIPININIVVDVVLVMMTTTIMILSPSPFFQSLILFHYAFKSSTWSFISFVHLQLGFCSLTSMLLYHFFLSSCFRKRQYSKSALIDTCWNIALSGKGLLYVCLLLKPGFRTSVGYYVFYENQINK